MCPKKVIEKYFKIIKFSLNDCENYLNCRLAIRKGQQDAKPFEVLGYTTNLENTKSLLKKLGFEGKYSEKSFKVAGVSEAFNNNITMEDAMYHGRWRSLDTPGVHCHQNKKKRRNISMYTC